jgi:hypothetical protein
VAKRQDRWEDHGRLLRSRSQPLVAFPAPITALVGRGGELIRLGRLIGDDRLATVTGPGGCGKTRLVVSRPGQGTFVARTLRAVAPSELASLRRALIRWFNVALQAGLAEEDVMALFTATLQEALGRGQETA